MRWPTPTIKQGEARLSKRKGKENKRVNKNVEGQKKKKKKGNLSHPFEYQGREAFMSNFTFAPSKWRQQSFSRLYHCLAKQQSWFIQRDANCWGPVPVMRPPGKASGSQGRYSPTSKAISCSPASCMWRVQLGPIWLQKSIQHSALSDDLLSVAVRYTWLAGSLSYQCSPAHSPSRVPQLLRPAPTLAYISYKPASWIFCLGLGWCDGSGSMPFIFVPSLASPMIGLE